MVLNLLKHDTFGRNIIKLSVSSQSVGGSFHQRHLHITHVPNALSNDLDVLPAHYKRGTGGRSSFSGYVATIFGATGNIGRILTNRFGKQGSQVIVPHRSDELYIRPLKLCGDLGQIIFLPLDLKNPDTIYNAVKKSNIVINCIGSEIETSNFSFEQVHVEAARNIARISRECGVEKLIHFSSLNASPNPKKIYKKDGSNFLKSKYYGEQAVKEEFPRAVIIRPSINYGEKDRFLYFYADTNRRFFNKIALWNKGERTIKMPVHQFDVATGVMKIVNNRDIHSQTFDFIGPNRYLLSDLIDYIMQVIRRPEVKRTYMHPYYFALTWLYEQFPKRRFYNFEKVELEFIDDEPTLDNPKLKDLGIEFTKLEEIAPWHLKQFNRFAYYDERLGEFPDPIPPKPLSDEYELQNQYKQARFI